MPKLNFRSVSRGSRYHIFDYYYDVVFNAQQHACTSISHDAITVSVLEQLLTP